MEINAAIDLAIQAAKKTGLYLKEVTAKNSVSVSSDNGKDIKTQEDLDAEKILLDTLSISDIPFLSEENGISKEFSQQHLYWVIDPIDGTLNLSRGIPFTCISIALYQGFQPLLGIVYDFLREELFTGSSATDAHLNQQRISVSPHKEPSNAILATGFPSGRNYGQKNLDKFVQQVRSFKKIRLIGSAALSLAYVSCGRFDAYTEEDIYFWDVAAGLALVHASGGFFQINHLDTDSWKTTVFAASSKSLFNSLQSEPNREK